MYSVYMTKGPPYTTYLLYDHSRTRLCYRQGTRALPKTKVLNASQASIQFAGFVPSELLLSNSYTSGAFRDRR